ncbi:hypothetical protein MACK_000536 [Theileria orientalis]|uniref:MIF4G domain-containing protein n=1 Tax=Theileria orientalis TaxID=68886 RepID=A0A976MBQ7_THEOR|nr:hypothetical protein MACK_000536 [Theileria orientalis]
MRLFRRASKITNVPAYDNLEPIKDQNDKMKGDVSDGVIKAQVNKGVDQSKSKEVHEKNEIKNSTYAKAMMDQREGTAETKQSGITEASFNALKEASANEASNQNSRTPMSENTRYVKNSPANNMSDNTHQPDHGRGDPLDRNSHEKRQEESGYANGMLSHTSAPAIKQDHAGMARGHWERNAVPVSTSDQTMVPSRSPDYVVSAESIGQVRVPGDHRISATHGDRTQNVHANADRRRYTRKSDASSDSHSRSSSSSYDSHGSYSRAARTRIINHPLPGSANMVIDTVNTATVQSGAPEGTVNSHLRGDVTGPKHSSGYTHGSHHPGYVNQLVGAATSNHASHASGDSSSSSSHTPDSNHSRVDQRAHERYEHGNVRYDGSNSRYEYASRGNGNGRYDHFGNGGRYEGSRVRSEDRSGEVHLGPRGDRPGMVADEMNYVEMEGYPVNRYGKYDQRTSRTYVDGYEHKMGDPKINYVNYKQERGKVSPQRKKMKNEYGHNVYQYGMNQQQPYMNQYMNYQNMNYQNYVNMNHYSQKHGEYQPHNTERHQMQGGHANQYQYKQGMRGGNGDHSKYYRDQYYTSPANRNVDQYMGYPAYQNVHYQNMVDPGAYKNYKMPMQKVNMYTQPLKQIKPRQSSALQILNPDTGEVVNSKKADPKGELSKAAPAGATADGGTATAGVSDSVPGSGVAEGGDSAAVDALRSDSSAGSVNVAVDAAGIHIVSVDAPRSDNVTGSDNAEGSAPASGEFADSGGMVDVPSSTATDAGTTSAVAGTTDVTASAVIATGGDKEDGDHVQATEYLSKDSSEEEVDGKEVDSGAMEATTVYTDSGASAAAVRGDTTVTKEPSTSNDFGPAEEDHEKYQQVGDQTPSKETTEKEYSQHVDDSQNEYSQKEYSQKEADTQKVADTHKEYSQKVADSQGYNKMEDALSPVNALKYAQTKQSQLLVNMSQMSSMQISKTRLRIVNRPINPSEKLYTLTELHPYKDTFVAKEHSKSQQRKIQNRPLSDIVFNEEINGVDGTRLMEPKISDSKFSDATITDAKLMDTKTMVGKKESLGSVDMGTSTELSDLILENSDSGSDSNKSRSQEQTDYESNRNAVMESGVMVTQYKAVESKGERGHVQVEKESDRLPQGPTYLFDTNVAVKTASGTVGATLVSSIGGLTSGTGVKSVYGSAAATAVAGTSVSTTGSATTGTTSVDTSSSLGTSTHRVTVTETAMGTAATTATATTIGTATTTTTIGTGTASTTTIGTGTTTTTMETSHGRTRVVATAEDDPSDPLRFSTLKMIYMGQELRRIGLEKNRAMGTFKLVPLNYSVGSSITSHAGQGSFQSHSSSFSEGYTTSTNTRRKSKKESKWRSELSIEKEELTTNKPKKPTLSKKEQFKRSVRTLLNKLTVENFLVVSEKIATLYKEAEDQESVRVIVDLLHEKATHELEYSDMYADLAFLLKYSFNDTLDLGSKTTCFHKTLLNKCQDSFEEISTNHALEKTYILGNIRFMGELFLRKILSITILKRISCTLMTSKYPEEGSGMTESALSQGGSTTRTTSVINEEVVGATASGSVNADVGIGSVDGSTVGVVGSVDGSTVGVGGSVDGNRNATASGPNDNVTGTDSNDNAGGPSDNVTGGDVDSVTTATNANVTTANSGDDSANKFADVQSANVVSGSDANIVGDIQVVGGSDNEVAEAASGSHDSSSSGSRSSSVDDTSVNDVAIGSASVVTACTASGNDNGTDSRTSVVTGASAEDTAAVTGAATSGSADENSVDAVNADATGSENVEASESAARSSIDGADNESAASAGATSRSSNASDDMEFRPPANLIECFSELLTTIGYTVDQIPGGSDMLDEYLAILISLKKSGIYPTRINFKIQDLIDLRKRNWRKKLFKEKATSVSQIHRLAEQEQLRGGPQEGRFVTAGLQTNRHYTPYLLKKRQQVVDSLVNGVYTQESAQKMRETGGSEDRRDESFQPQMLKLFTSAVGRESFQKEWRTYRPTEESVTHTFDQMLKATMSAKTLELCLAHADILSLTLARLVDTETLRARLLNMLCEYYVVNLQEEIIDNPWAMDIVSKTLTFLFNDFTGEARSLLEKIPIPKHFPTAKQLVINIVNGTRELGGDLGFTRRVIRRHLYSTFHNENLLFLDEI